MKYRNGGLVMQLGQVDYEAARVSAWHETFNAALAGLLTRFNVENAIRCAKKAADKTHGEIE